MIGIIGAMDKEVSIYLKHLTQIKKIKYRIFTFYLGQLHHHKVIIVKSGVGKVFASMITQYLIDKFNVKAILLTGVGGALNPKLKIGDVVIGRDSVYHDFNAIPLGFKRGQISYTNYRFFKADRKLINQAKKTKLNGPHLMVGRILTGDQFLTHKEKEKYHYLRKELKGDCIEMEGAAVAQVCNLNQIPHLIVRTISDQADGTAVRDYNKFTELVASNSFKVVNQVLQSFT